LVSNLGGNLPQQRHAASPPPLLTAGENILDVLDHIPTAFAFVSTDADFKVLYVNHAFTRIFGYLADEVMKVSHWAKLVYPDVGVGQSRFSTWQREVETARKLDNSIPDRESHALCKDGTYRDVIVQTTLLDDLLLLTFTDITEQKRMATDLLEKEKQFRQFVENANDIIYTLDLEGNFTYLSPNTLHTLGWEPAELIGRHFKNIVHPAELEACIVAFGSALSGNDFVNVEYRARRKDETWTWQSSNVRPIRDASERITAVIGVGRDVNQRKLAEEKLQLSEARYRLLSDSVRDVIWTVAADGSITYVSASVEQTRGFTPQEVKQQTMDEMLTPESVILYASYMSSLQADLAADRKPKQLRAEMEYRCKDGSTYWCEVIATPILTKDGSFLELLGVSRDITEHKKYESELKRAQEATDALNRALEAANERLNEIALTDALTGLWNRRHFEDAVEHEMAVSNRYGSHLSAISFDIDHFKRVNDTYGHLAGDSVLIALSELTRKHTRASDLPCRWGGEEFMVLMPNTDSTEAVLVAEKLRVAFASHEIPEVGKVTASFGVTTYHPNESLDSWISRTDAAMYQAKREGRNTVRLN
jgi:diguanylate cyclase (GGDEF)-like protein/PAS domain S-box-containing protein